MVVGYVGVLISPEVDVLTDGLVTLIVEYDVTTLAVAHAAVHLDVLEVGVCCTAFQAQYITTSDTFQYVCDIVAIAAFYCWYGIGDRSILIAFTDDRYIRSIHIGGSTWILLAINTSHHAVRVGRNLIVALLDEDAETLAGISTLGCCSKSVGE